jgi:hypothetical protein
MLENINTLLTECSAKAIQASIQATPSEEIDKDDEVLRQVAAFCAENPADCSGWLCFTDRVEVITGGFDFTAATGRILLNGELACGTKSLHLRQSEKGWIIYRLERTDGGEMLMFEENYLPMRKDMGKLRYEMFWRKEKNSEEQETYRPYASRFAGFTPQGGK